jgi:hypothetical protein
MMEIFFTLPVLIGWQLTNHCRPRSSSRLVYCTIHSVLATNSSSCCKVQSVTIRGCSLSQVKETRTVAELRAPREDSPIGILAFHSHAKLLYFFQFLLPLFAFLSALFSRSTSFIQCLFVVVLLLRVLMPLPTGTAVAASPALFYFILLANRNVSRE